MNLPQYQIWPEFGLVAARWHGRVSDEVVLAGFAMVRADARWRPGFDELHYVGLANVEDVTAGGLRSLVELRRGDKSQATSLFKTAVVTPGDLAFGLGRMYGVFAEETPEAVHIFRDLAGAVEWLEASPEVLEWVTSVSEPSSRERPGNALAK